MITHAQIAINNNIDIKSSNKSKTSFNMLYLRWMLILVKKRKLNVEMGNLEYSQYFMNQEKEMLEPLFQKSNSSLFNI